MKKTFTFFTLLLLLFLSISSLEASNRTPIRRPISPQQPMWLIHIDTWNYADPQKIIDLIPADIRPYVVMNISLSINHDENTGKWITCEYGYETAKSWLRTCAENQMWAVVQPSSGGFSHFSDFDLSVYEEFFREYPNFLGINYCEQFWGFDDKYSVTYPQRLAHWVNLMKVNQKYGGYLIVSFCGSYYGASLNPVAMMKRDAEFAAICKEDPEHFILCEKYTSAYGFFDIESTCEGTFLSGFSGNYGIRFDQCGWVGNTAEEKFPVAAGSLPTLEHVMLTGQTVIDGPELIWQQCFRELNASSTPDGFSKRRWERFPQFDNLNIDHFRKILDGTIRIMSRKEVIDRTKVVIINDVNSGNDQDKYSTPQTLFDGLYRMDNDGTYISNTSYFKKTGRYPTIPIVYQLGDSLAKTFQVKVNKSQYSSRWGTTSTKVNEFNNLFPQEYTGDIFAGRNENGWVVYNPYKTGIIAKGSIPFKYNTCEKMELALAQYSSGVIKEFSDKLTFYLTNYDNYYTALKTDTIKIFGSKTEPTFTYYDRGNHQASVIKKTWNNDIFTLIITHNGPLDITVNCSGTATNRLTSFKTAELIIPALPAVYTGPRQYEAENFDYKNISRNYTSGVNSGVANYTAQGFLKFGTNSAASIRDTVTVLKDGTYDIDIKYSSPAGNVNHIQLYVNNQMKAIPTFTRTASSSTWSVCRVKAELKAGKNVIMFKASRIGSYEIYFDNVVISREDNNMYNFQNDFASEVSTEPAAQFFKIKSGSAGVVNYSYSGNEAGKALKTYTTGNLNKTGVADLELLPNTSTDQYLVWKEYYNNTGGKKGFILRGSETSSYAEGMNQGYLFVSENNADNTITIKTYISTAESIIPVGTYTSTFKTMTGKPYWFRASTVRDNIKFECSSDSINWSGASSTAFKDNKYTKGSTQFVWGLQSDQNNWIIDNIVLKSSALSVSKLKVSGFNYIEGQGPSASQSIILTGKDLTSDVKISAPVGYEVSLLSDKDFGQEVLLKPEGGNFINQSVYVRLIPGMSTGVCYGNLEISSEGIDTVAVSLTGSISGLMSYTFDNDKSATFAQTPPAEKVVIASGNGSTAGVSPTPLSNNKAFRAFSGGERNGTGVATLSMFPSAATEYSVTWKYTIGSANTEYKVGLLLRGTAPAASTTTGYVSGLMQGYLFLVYHNTNKANTEFRIYKPVNVNSSLERIAVGTVALSPSVGTPVWFRAGTSGISPVNLKFEYSTDSITWKNATTTSDATSPFSAGATQIVWGLAASGMDFYIDNITFAGSTGVPAPLTNVNNDNLNVIDTEYYTISGVRVRKTNGALKGLYILRKLMSDGSYRTEKVMFK